MRVLGIESSSLVASVAVATEGILNAEYTTNFKKTHSQTLLPMIDQMMEMLGIELSSIDAIAVSGGPGSFTGLRIGAATAKGLGLALQKPLIHVPTIDAMAYQFFGVDAFICPIMDARRNQVYTGIYNFRQEFKIMKPQFAADVAALMSELEQINEPVIFLGDGVPVYENIIKENRKIDYRFAPLSMNRQRAATVAALGMDLYKAGRYCAPKDFAPDYLRKSQAERERGL